MICQKLDVRLGSLVVPEAEPDQRREVLQAVLDGLRSLPGDREPVVLPVSGFQVTAEPGAPATQSSRGWIEMRLADGTAAGASSTEMLAELVAAVERKMAAEPVGVGS